MIENSESLFINIHADCQEANAYIDKTLINPVNIFVGVPINFENNLFRIVNPSNLPINFELQSINNPDEKIIEFYPRRGTVRPRSYVEISYRMTYFLCKLINILETRTFKFYDFIKFIKRNAIYKKYFHLKKIKINNFSENN